MENISVTGYQKVFEKLDKKLFEEDKKKYEAILIFIKMTELVSKGMKTKKVLKANKKGTAINFTQTKDSEEFKECYIELNKEFKEIEEYLKTLVVFKPAKKD